MVNAPPQNRGRGVAQQKVGQAGLWMAGWLTATLGMTVAGRQLAQEVSVFEVMLLRSVIATIILTPIVMLNGGLKDRVSQLKLHGARNVVHYAGQYAWFSALLLIPLAEQGEKLASKWSRLGVEVVVEALAPSAGEQEADAAARRLAAKKPDLVAMDCMSYSPTTKAWVKPGLGVPTLLAITATGRVLRELLD